MEIRGHGGITQFGNSKGRGVKIWKPSWVWYGNFLELPNEKFGLFLGGEGGSESC